MSHQANIWYKLFLLVYLALKNNNNNNDKNKFNRSNVVLRNKKF